MATVDPTKLAPALAQGDEVVAVAASSAIDNEEGIIKGLKVLESWGLICRPQTIYKRRWGYLAGNDETRFSELHPKSNAPLIIFARGGWGSARLLELDQEESWSIGWMLGFSDVTSLLLARLTSGFGGCIHGPLLTTLYKEPDWSKERLKSILFKEQVNDLHGDSWSYGLAIGPLVVANLTVASHLIGSRYFPDLRGAILVLEDIGEEPYRIDRMLTQWRLSGILQAIAGLGFGRFLNCEAPDEIPPQETFRLEEVLKERSSDLGIPVVGNLPIGHGCGNAAMPLGHKTLLNGTKGLLQLIT